jgi:hypothetical protein
MKRKFRIIIGMLLFAIPLSMTAQVKPVKPQKSQTEINEKEKAEVIRIEKEKEKAEKEGQIKPQVKPAEKPEAKPADRPERPEKPQKPENDRPKLGDFIKLSGFAQGMYQANLNNEGELIDNTFSMRRVRLSVEGTFVKGLTYKIQGDFTRKPMLVDAYLKYKPCNEFAIQIGQFKTPFSIESPINPVSLEIFDYGEAIQGLVGYKDVCGVGSIGRDLGIMATGSLFPIKGEEGIKYHVVEYSLGVFNGNGANEKDNNNRKDVVGRLDIHPGLKALTLSGSLYLGKYSKDENINCTRNRWAAGAQYNDGSLIVRGEYLHGTTGYFDGTLDDENNPIELYQFSNGYYAEAGYYFKFGKEKGQKLMPVLRYEHFEPGDRTGEVHGLSNYYTAGLNYWPIKNVNLKVDYSLVEKVIGEKAYTHRLVGMVCYKFN